MTSDSATEPHPGPPFGPHSRRDQIATVVAMYVGYATFMMLRMAPTVASAAIYEDKSLGVDVAVWGRIVAAGIWGSVLGKLICGYAADRFGGRRTFAWGLLATSLCIGLFGVARTEWQFQAAFFLALAARAAGWPAMARLIGNWFTPAHYGRVWGVVSTSSRVGTLTATLGLGSLLVLVTWREMLWLSAALGLVATVALVMTLRERPGAPNGASIDASGSARDETPLAESLSFIFSSPRFWLMAVSQMGLAILWDFLLMVPLYLKQTLGLSAAEASRAASAIPFGSLISVLAGGYLFDKLSRRATAAVMGLLLTIASVCVFLFLRMPTSGLSVDVVGMLSLWLLFTFGLCVSPCYYIPMSVFSMEFDSPRSGLVISLLDALSFVATATFYYYGGSLAKQSWSLFLSVLLAVSIWSAISLVVFLLNEARRRPSVE